MLKSNNILNDCVLSVKNPNARIIARAFVKDLSMKNVEKL
jgi:hypothetical protein